MHMLLILLALCLRKLNGISRLFSIAYAFAGNGWDPTNYRALIQDRLQEIKHDNRIAYLTWSMTPALAYYKALKLRALLRQEVLAALDHADVLVMPTMGSAAPKIEPDPIIDSKERSNRNRAGLTTAFSLASAPALSLCCGFTAEH